MLSEREGWAAIARSAVRSASAKRRSVRRGRLARECLRPFGRPLGGFLGALVPDAGKVEVALAGVLPPPRERGVDGRRGDRPGSFLQDRKVSAGDPPLETVGVGCEEALEGGAGGEDVARLLEAEREPEARRRRRRVALDELAVDLEGLRPPVVGVDELFRSTCERVQHADDRRDRRVSPQRLFRTCGVLGTNPSRKRR
jgi:hypothetical protein